MLELKNINKVFNIGTVDETVLFNDFNFTCEYLRAEEKGYCEV